MLNALTHTGFWLAFSPLATIIGFYMDVLGFRTHVMGMLHKSATNAVSIMVRTPPSLLATAGGALGIAALAEVAIDHHHDIATALDAISPIDGHGALAGLADMPSIDLADLPIAADVGDLLSTLSDAFAFT